MKEDDLTGILAGLNGKKMSETEEAPCCNAVSGMDGSLGGVKYGAPYGANKHFQCLRTIQTDFLDRTNHRQLVNTCLLGLCLF